MRMALLAGIALWIGSAEARGQDRSQFVTPPANAEIILAERWVGPAAGATGEGNASARFWAEADYLLYWLKPVCLKPPTLSIGNLNDPQPGVLGQPGTRLIQGEHKFEFGGASGIRPRLGAWLTNDQFLGVEVEGFVLEQVAASQLAGTQNGSPPLFLVFQNPDNTHAALPFSVPGVVNGSSVAVGSTQLWGVEANLGTHFWTDRGAWKLHATFLAGCRYLHLDDRVVITNRQSLVGDPSVLAVGESTFSTRNQFVGGQIGSRFGLERGCFALDLTTKLAVGEAHLVSQVSGGPLLTGASVQPPLVPGPLLALPSNVGEQESDRIAVVPEVNLRLRWQVNARLYLTLSYNVLYWNKVLCPGDQMSSLANPTQLPFRGPVVGPRVPAPQFVFTDAFAHGLEAGLGFRF